MNYNDLKTRLYKIKRVIEDTNNLKFISKNMDKNIITNDLVQYFIFIEELENKIKKDKSISIEKHKKELLLINQYISILEKKFPNND